MKSALYHRLRLARLPKYFVMTLLIAGPAAAQDEGTALIAAESSPLEGTTLLAADVAALAAPEENVEVECCSFGAFLDAGSPVDLSAMPAAASPAYPLPSGTSSDAVTESLVTGLSAASMPATTLSISPSVAFAYAGEASFAEKVNPVPKCSAPALPTESSMELLIGCLIDDDLQARTAANDRLLSLLESAVDEVTSLSDEAPSGIDFLYHRLVQEFLNASRRYLAGGPDLELVQRLQSIVSSPRIRPYFINAALANDDEFTVSNRIYYNLVLPWMTFSSHQAALITLLTEGESLMNHLAANYVIREHPKVNEISKSIPRAFLLRLQWDIIYNGEDGSTAMIETRYEGLVKHIPSGHSYYIKDFFMDNDVNSKLTLVYRSPMTIPLTSLLSDRTILLLVLLNRLSLGSLAGAASVTVGMCAAPNYTTAPESFRNSFTLISETLPIVFGVCNELRVIGEQQMTLNIDSLPRGVFNAIFLEAGSVETPVQSPSFHQILEALLRR